MEKEIKIITLGESGVGKTSIINRICYNSFNENEKTNNTTDFHYLTKFYSKKKMKIILNFIDTAGQEQYIKILPKQYIRNSEIVLLVFSNLVNLETLKTRWLEFYKENANIEKSNFILIGNKSDIFGYDKIKIKELGEQFSEEMDAFFITCSAKSEDNIDNLINIIVTKAKRLIDEEEKAKIENNIYKLNNDQGSFKVKKVYKKKKCCK